MNGSIQCYETQTDRPTGYNPHHQTDTEVKRLLRFFLTTKSQPSGKEDATILTTEGSRNVRPDLLRLLNVDKKIFSIK